MQDEILNKIKNAHNITIFRHIKPDGDAYGAQMGLKEIILDNFPSKNVYVLGEQNNHWGKLMGKMDEDVSDEIIASSLAIVLDTANIARVDNSKFSLAKDIIKIDHHLFVENFGGYEWIEPNKISTCELLTMFAKENNLMVSKEAASYLFVGIVTDSGRFEFQNTSTTTFDAASFLLTKGIEMTKLYHYIYDTLEDEVRFRGYCELNYKKTKHGVAYMFISEDIQKEFGVYENQGSGFVNCLADIRGINMWVFFTQKEDGKVKVELRSRRLPVNEIAKKYGGGGHHLASGAIIDNFEVAKEVLKDMDKVCEDDQYAS